MPQGDGKNMIVSQQTGNVRSLILIPVHFFDSHIHDHILHQYQSDMLTDFY